MIPLLRWVIRGRNNKNLCIGESGTWHKNPNHVLQPCRGPRNCSICWEQVHRRRFRAGGWEASAPQEIGLAD